MTDGDLHNAPSGAAVAQPRDHDRAHSADEHRAVVRAAAQRSRADAAVLRMRAALASDEAEGYRARIEVMLNIAHASLDAALAVVDEDADAARDDIVAARSLIAAAIVVAEHPT